MNDENEINLDGIQLSLDDDVMIDTSDTFTITIPNIDDNGSYSSSTYDFSNYDFNLNYNPGIDITNGDLTVHDKGDVKLGDRSLKEFMDKVEERLNILQPNPGLEDKWDELKRLGNAYRELEQELLQKQKVWEALNQE